MKMFREPTPADNILLQHQPTIRAARANLESAAIKVITTIGCINIYPDGADKDKAIKDAEKAKKSLLCAIGSHDGEIQSYRDALKVYSDEERIITKCWDEDFFANSHEVIEMTYKKFYKGV
jgi:hypothetical protein